MKPIKKFKIEVDANILNQYQDSNLAEISIDRKLLISVAPDGFLKRC